MKKYLVLILSFILMIIFIGCDKDGGKISYDANTVADALNSSLEFGESLEKSTADALYSVYGIDPALCKDAAFYANSGAVADEIAVFDCVESNVSVGEVLKAINSRIEYLRDGYSSYGPDQVPKIDNAVIISEGDIVIMCICENPENVTEIFYLTAITK